MTRPLVACLCLAASLASAQPADPDQDLKEADQRLKAAIAAGAEQAYVAGVAADLIARGKELGYQPTAEELKEILTKSAKGGRIDVEAAHMRLEELAHDRAVENERLEHVRRTAADKAQAERQKRLEGEVLTADRSGKVRLRAKLPEDGEVVCPDHHGALLIIERDHFELTTDRQSSDRRLSASKVNVRALDNGGEAKDVFDERTFVFDREGYLTRVEVAEPAFKAGLATLSAEDPGRAAQSKDLEKARLELARTLARLERCAKEPKE